MIDFKKEIAEIIAKNLEGLTEDEIKSMIEIPQDQSMGDYAFPCFRLAKTMRKAPNLIAAELAEKLQGEKLFSEVSPVNAYVNMFVSREEMMKSTVSEVLEEKENFGRSDIGGNKKVIVEFSSPNIAKPFHIGHIRSTVIGNSLSKIYDALGYDVFKINHLGDYGTQFGKMICAYRRWGNREDVINSPIKTLLGYYTKFHVEVEEHPELEDEARAIFTKLEQGSKEEVELWQWFREESLKEFQRVYDMLGIEFDSYNGESFYSDKMPRFEKELSDKGLLQESNGAQVVDLEEYKLGTALIKKSDGSSLYITRDIAAAVYRKENYDFYKNIYVVATQQNLHFQQLFKIIELMGYDWANQCVHVPFGMVRLEEGTMSTRHGRVVFLEDVLNGAIEKTREIIEEKNPNIENLEEITSQVGIGAVVFNELSNNRIKDYTFKWGQILNFDGETGPYVQYTHARCASLLRKAGEDIVAKAQDPKNVDFALLAKSDSAYELTKLIYAFPGVVEQAGEKYEPSIITRHIIDIAQCFNKFYHDEHIIVDDEVEKISKIALVIATKRVIATGIGLLGMKAPERM
ncbi:MAG: arginine--tRNA ligase [[Eubacterium] sulci]|nr:arginine--tRNA ligase [[Eubacterium] sulci]